MARIRSIKPDFFRHRRLYLAERDTGLPLRVAFAGLWTVADREGRFRWEPDELKLDCLPYDDVDFSRVLDALTTRGFLVRYASQGREYGFIPGFTRHQIINNRETASILPTPPEGVENIDKLTRAARVVDACPTPLVQDQGEGKGREGDRKRKESPPPTPASKARSPAAVAVVDAFIAAKDARWPEHAEQIAPRTTLEALAQQHLDAGGTVELLTEVIQRAVRDWRNPTPPTSLAALKNSLADRVAQHRRALDGGGGRNASGSVGDQHEVDPHDQSRQRLRHWVRTGRWEPRWGEMPGHRSCLIPERVVLEVIPDFKPGWRPPAAVGNAGGAA